MAHFSAGDLLREHVKSGTPDGNAVNEMIKQGQIVPAEVRAGRGEGEARVSRTRGRQ